MKQVLLYGGAFNPPTIAHQAIIKALIQIADSNGHELWIMPSGTRSDKTIDVAEGTRLAYLKALLSGLPGGSDVKIETSELLHTVQTETFETVRRLSELYPDKHFTWVFGTDSVVTMKFWRGGEWLYENLEMLLITRKGHILSTMPPKSKLLSVDTPVISSTIVRNLIKQQKTFQKFVPKEVFEVLTSNRL